MEKKQSSIDWFEARMLEILSPLNMVMSHEQWEMYDKAHEQAKAMHREEHLETWVESAVQHRKENHYRKKKILFFEEYYNETYRDGKETK